MTHTHTSDHQEQNPSVSSAPRSTEVRVARINPKVLFWTVMVTIAVVALSFASIIIHGLVITGKW